MQHEPPNMKALTTCSFAERNDEKIQLKQTLKSFTLKLLCLCKVSPSRLQIIVILASPCFQRQPSSPRMVLFFLYLPGSHTKAMLSVWWLLLSSGLLGALKIRRKSQSLPEVLWGPEFLRSCGEKNRCHTIVDMESLNFSENWVFLKILS